MSRTSAHHLQVQHDQARSKEAEVRMMVYGSLRDCKGRLRHGHHQTILYVQSEDPANLDW